MVRCEGTGSSAHAYWVSMPTRSAAAASFLLALATASLSAQQASPSAFAGTWFGSFTVTAPDGSQHRDSAVLVLHEEDGRLTGRMGSAIDQLAPIRDIQVNGNAVRFHMDAAGGLDFTLKLAAGHLTGASSGNMHASVDVQPAPGLLPHDQLVAEITEADRKSFEAFDACDAHGYGSYLAPDLEFYRDKLGKTDFQYQLDSLRQRCGEGIVLRRELDPASLVIDAAPGNEAIEAGTHRFYSKQKDGSEHLDATAEFTEIWSKASGHWQLERVISYDHH